MPATSIIDETMGSVTHQGEEGVNNTQKPTFDEEMSLIIMCFSKINSQKFIFMRSFSQTIEKLPIHIRIHIWISIKIESILFEIMRGTRLALIDNFFISDCNASKKDGQRVVWKRVYTAGKKCLKNRHRICTVVYSTCYYLKSDW